MPAFRRRSILQGIASSGTLLGLAGCLGDETDDDDDGDEPPSDIPARLHAHLEFARGYDRSIDDRRDEDSIEVAVGAGSEGFAFDPVAARIDAGTTLVWRWTGAGGAHDVVSVGSSDFQFESERTRATDHTFEQTFETSGVALYDCRPHRTHRMLGGIDLVLPDDDIP